MIGQYTAEELTHFASHGFRPVVMGNPANLPEGIGYAEAMNAGKSRLNEDEAACFRGQLRKDDKVSSRCSKKARHFTTKINKFCICKMI